MDGITEENNTDIRFYSVDGERVACAYTAEDFLGCPETRRILVEDEEQRYESAIEQPVVDYLISLCEEEQEALSSVFGNTTPGKFAGLVSALLRSFVHPDYDYSIFGREPELAAPLKAFIESSAESVKSSHT